MKALILLSLLIYSGFSFANFNISPLSQSISTKTKNASYTLENLTDRNVAYEVIVTSRDINHLGQEIRSDTKEIRVFPSKIILSPQEKKRIKVIYLGKRSIEQEKAFRVIFKQLDKDVSEIKSDAINSKFNFHTAFYVSPPKAKSNLSAKLIDHADGIKLSLNNKGNAHIILQDWQLKLTSNGKSHIYSNELPNLNVLAGKEVLLPLKGEIETDQQAEVILN